MQAGHDRNNHSGLKAMTPACSSTGSLQVKFVPNSRKAFSYINFTNEFACMASTTEVRRTARHSDSKRTLHRDQGRFT